MKKLVLVYLLLVFLLSGCVIRKEIVQKIYVNEFDAASIESLDNFEQVIEVASNTAVASSVGIACQNSTSLLGTKASGSAVIIKKVNNTYYCITNRHVITASKGYYDTIHIYEGQTKKYIKAKIFYLDFVNDLVILEFTSELEFVPVKIAEEIKLGQFCVAVGSPHDLETYYNSVSVGNISALNRVIAESVGNKIYNLNYLQHTAAINSGSSGGGLFNLKGELIGINTWKIQEADYTEGLNFSIGIKEIKALINEAFK